MLSKKEVEKVAKLARIDLTASEVAKMRKELSEVFDYFNLLKKAKSRSGRLERPTTGISDKNIPFDLDKKERVVRKDDAKSQEDEVVKGLIKAVPDTKENYIKVHPVRNNWG